MATYQSVNGKAPSGLKVGDSVVTNGGTYTITGVNSDGSYSSAKSSNTTKSSYTGSYATAPSSAPSGGSSGGSSSGGSSGGSSAAPGSGAVSGISTVTAQQQAIKDQMAANSQAWYNAATKEQKDALHAQNVALSQQLAALGVSASYDGKTGTWTGGAEVPQLEQYYQQAAANTYTPTDNSAYLKEMAAAYLKQQQEALKSAYETNLSNLQAEQDKLGAQYTAAKNAESANDALARQRWNETAAAYGLNSGTQGQAQLAFATQKQQDLSNIQQAEAAANAEVERQRTLLGQQYQSAMTQALEANNYQLFQQLYNEAVRLDQAIQNQQQFDSSMALKQYQTALDQYNTDRNFNYTQQLNAWQQQYQLQKDAAEKQLTGAGLLANAGNISGYRDYFGWDDATANGVNSYYQALAAAQLAKASGAKSSGSGGSGGSGSTKTGSAVDYQGAYQSGARTYADAKAYFYGIYKNNTIAKDLAEQYIQMMNRNEFSAPADPSSADLGPTALNILRSFVNNTMTTAQKVTAVQNAMDSGSIASWEADYLLSVAGV